MRGGLMTTKIRKSIEEVLGDFVVTDELRHRTLEQIKARPNQHYKGFRSSFYLKAVTLMSSFIVLLTLSINVFYKVDTNAVNPQQHDLMKQINSPQEFSLSPLTPEYGAFENPQDSDVLEEELTKSEEDDE